MQSPSDILKTALQAASSGIRRWRTFPLWILQVSEKYPLFPKLYLLGFAVLVVGVALLPLVVNWYAAVTFVPPPPPVPYPSATVPAAPQQPYAPTPVPSPTRSPAPEPVSETHARLDNNTVTITWSRPFNLQSMLMDGSYVTPNCSGLTCSLPVNRKPNQLEVRWYEDGRPMSKLFSFQSGL